MSVASAGSQATWKKPQRREVYGANDTDWDLCTNFARRGRCPKENCSWRHEGGVLWDGQWWRSDGKGWDGKDAPVDDDNSGVSALRSAFWWKTLPVGEECPVSLTPIRELEREPFELSAHAPDSKAGKRGLKHRFDAFALANFLVSSGQFMNPVNRRPLELSECQALDKCLGKAWNLRVADAFLLSGGSTLEGVAKRELSSMAHHLFRFPSVRDDATANGEVGPSRNRPANKAAPTRPMLPQRDARTVHSEGGLQVIDDNESDDGQGEAAQETDPVLVAAAAPTPAQAAAVSGVNPPRPPRAPRPAPQPHRSAASTSGASCTPSCQPVKVPAAADSKATVACRRNADREASVAEASSSSAEVWVPDWATSELQATQLAEVEEVYLSGQIIVEETSLDALRRAVTRGSLLTDEQGLRCTVWCDEIAELSLEMTLPPFYPTLPLQAIIPCENAKGESAELVVALQTALRDEVLKPTEGGKALQAAADWWKNHAPVRLAELREQLQVQRQRADRALQDANARRAEDVKEDEKSARTAEKFSPAWDLCSGFLKTGKCKNKNCKWRHEIPEKPAPAPKSCTADISVAEASAKRPAGRKK